MNTGDKTDVVVLGAGVIGLVTALRLLERGFSVTILADAFSPHTTSNVAGALWYPHRVGPPDRIDEWCRRSYPVFRELCSNPSAGVALRPLLVLPGSDEKPPAWSDVAGLQLVGRDKLPPGYDCGFAMLAPVVESDTFLEWLLARVRALGAVVEKVPASLTSFEPLFTRGQVVVHCTGIGARKLVDDRDLHPVRGQLLRVEGPRIVRSVCDDGGPLAGTYVIARTHDTIVGTTHNVGDWNLDVYPGETMDILARATRLVPELSGARILDQRVGLRPARSGVRLEVEHTPAGPVLHHYGHGGAGVTLSFGCADEAAGLVEGLLGSRR